MFNDFASWAVVLLILVSSGAMLISRDWRIQLAALALQYLAAFWLITRHQPFVIGSAKLVTGWMVVAALGMTRLGIQNTEEDQTTFVGPNNRWFSVVLLGIIALVTAGATPQIEAVIPGLGLSVIAGGLLLISTGLIHLGLTSDILRVIISLLTLIAGFEIIYAAVENSILVAGLLALTNLGLGLAGSYLLLAGKTQLFSNLEEEEIE
jgi:hypothetical protein